MCRMVSRALLPAVTVIALVCGCHSDAPEDAGSSELVVARVNGVPITRMELDAAVRHARRVYAAGAEPSSELAEGILTRMIEDELLTQHARAIGVQVSDDEVGRRLARIKQAGGGDPAYSRFLQEAGLDAEQVKKNLMRNLIVERLYEGWEKTAEISDAECLKYYSENPDEFRSKGSVKLAHVLIQSGKGGDEQALARAQRVHAEIQGGLSFEAAVKKYSQDPHTSGREGVLGTFQADELRSDLNSAAFSICVGCVSTPVKGEKGYHLLKVLARSPAEVPAFHQVKGKVRQFVRQAKVKQKAKTLLERLREEGSVQRSPAPHGNNIP